MESVSPGSTRFESARQVDSVGGFSFSEVIDCLVCGNGHGAQAMQDAAGKTGFLGVFLVGVDGVEVPTCGRVPVGKFAGMFTLVEKSALASSRALVSSREFRWLCGRRVCPNEVGRATEDHGLVVSNQAVL